MRVYGVCSSTKLHTGFYRSQQKTFLYNMHAYFGVGGILARHLYVFSSLCLHGRSADVCFSASSEGMMVFRVGLYVCHAVWISSERHWVLAHHARTLSHNYYEQILTQRWMRACLLPSLLSGVAGKPVSRNPTNARYVCVCVYLVMTQGPSSI